MECGKHIAAALAEENFGYMGDVIVVGGGPAGALAALAAAEQGHKVTLLEKNEKLGKKLFLTGKGRCNITNAGDMDNLLGNVMTNPKFLYSAFYAFDNQSVVDFFGANGLKTKTERGNRVFPVSDHSSDVIAALQRALRRAGVDVRLGTEVAGLRIASAGDEASCRTGPAACFGAGVEGGKTCCGTGEAGTDEAGTGGAGSGEAGTGGAGVAAARDAANCRAGPAGRRRIAGVRLTGGGELAADAVIVATGGLSYQSTGSTGDGYRFAREAGHTVVPTSPSLVPFAAKEDYAGKLQGLSLRNVRVRIRDGRKVLYEDFGEMLFTHFGVSGPLILSASAVIRPPLAGKQLSMEIDLKPALTEEQLDLRLRREFEMAGKRQFKNSIGSLFPAKLIPVMTELSGIAPEKRANEITREEREGFLGLIKAFPLTLCGVRGFNEAVITRGGVCVREINPSTMESKLVDGLYFCGEILDVDAMTGGYNLQIAWSTGHLAGSSVKKR